MVNSIEEASELTSRLKSEVNKRVFGMDDILDAVLITMYAGGHIILQGVPGTAKTRLLKSVAEAISVPFERIQMAPDLLPSDIIGQEVFNPYTKKLEFRKGPILQASILLADELNRAPAKTKAAILEPMAEKQVTLTVHTQDGAEESERRIALPEEFTVFATQNPIEQMGTYRLAEAEADRFLMKKIVGYVSEKDELAIATMSPVDESIERVMSKEDILDIRSLVWEGVYTDPRLQEKIVRMVRMTRPSTSDRGGHDLANKKLKVGASPRAQQALMRTSKALAFLRGREHVTPEDVMDLGYSVLCHRVNFESPHKQEWDGILKDLLNEIYARVFGGVGG